MRPIPSVPQNSDPVGTGIGSFFGAFANSMNKNQQAKQAQQLAETKTRGQEALANYKNTLAQPLNNSKINKNNADAGKARATGTDNIDQKYFKGIQDTLLKANTSRREYIKNAMTGDKYGLLQPGTPEYTQVVHQLDDEWAGKEPANAYLAKNSTAIQSAIGKQDKNALTGIFKQMGQSVPSLSQQPQGQVAPVAPQAQPQTAPDMNTLPAQ